MKYKEQQLIEQARWVPRSQTNPELFKQLLENEYIDAQTRQNNLNLRVTNLLNYCVNSVPFYKRLIDQHEIDIQSCSTTADLQQLPVLHRATLQTRKEELKSRQLPAGHKPAGYTETSGSTGQPVEVLHTVSSFQSFGVLKQREYRSWGFDPSQRFGSVRPASDLPYKNGQELTPQSTLTLPSWEYVGDYFKTGDMPMLPDTSGIEFIVNWLDQHKPGYLIGLSAVLEQIALAYSDHEIKSEIAGSLAISQQLTPGMRDLIEQQVSPTVAQNYGLNEVGIVAMRCPESGYYHVHNENCLIEVIDQNGNACEPGKPGKLLVTSLANLAMPLLRYDTDDLAEIPTEHCPCGRTLQSFSNLRGRYRRTAHLPKGTWDYWDTLLRVFSQASPQEMASIEQYQLHQLSADNFNLKLKVKTSLAESLKNKIYAKWETATSDPTATLTITELDEIQQTGKKFQNFISDITPED